MGAWGLFFRKGEFGELPLHCTFSFVTFLRRANSQPRSSSLRTPEIEAEGDIRRVILTFGKVGLKEFPSAGPVNMYLLLPNADFRVGACF
jgi:hypothetical protein